MLTSMLGLTGVLWGLSPGDPEPFLDGQGHQVAGSISEKISVPINGVDQGMIIRGHDASNPLLLWVHGGPGMPDYFMTQDYPTGLEDLVTIVWWDQRGAGLSYAPEIPAESMTIEQFIDDTLAVTDYLRERFDQDQIYLLGHSWGSFIALQAAARAPEKYAAYIGMAQVVHQLQSEKLAYDYMLDAYRHRGDNDMVERLEAAPVTTEDGTPDSYLKVRDAAMHGLGVGTMREMDSVVSGIFLRSLRFRGYTMREKLDLWRGRKFSRGFGMWEPMIHTDLRQLVPELDVPAHFLEGKYDYTCVTSLAKDYFRRLRAPTKSLHVFENSAHSPLLEEPDQGHDIFARVILQSTPSRPPS